MDLEMSLSSVLGLGDMTGLIYVGFCSVCYLFLLANGSLIFGVLGNWSGLLFLEVSGGGDAQSLEHLIFPGFCSQVLKCAAMVVFFIWYGVRVDDESITLQASLIDSNLERKDYAVNIEADMKRKSEKLSQCIDKIINTSFVTKLHEAEPILHKMK